MDYLGKTVSDWTSSLAGNLSTPAKGKAPVREPQHTAATPSKRPLLSVDLESRQSFGPVPPTLAYGPTDHGGSADSSLTRDRLGRVEEEGDGDEDDYDLPLEERGLYSGSYKRVVALFTLVPFASGLLLLLLAPFPAILQHPLRDPPHDPPHSFLPVPFPELLLAAALFSLAHLLRVPLYTTLSALLSPLRRLLAPPSRPARLSLWLTALLSTALHALLVALLRLFAFELLFRTSTGTAAAHPSWRSWAFSRAWALALGWALAEAGASVAQGYAQLALYRAVLVPAGDSEERKPFLGGPITMSPSASLSLGRASTVDEDAGAAETRERELVEDEVERDLDQLVALKARQELEEVYGCPLVDIPVFISCLQRIDAIVLALGLTLLLGAAYLRSAVSAPVPPPRRGPTDNHVLWLTLPPVVLVHAALALLHTPLVLPRIGIHVAAYVTLPVALGTLFAGLAVWGVLS